MQCCSVSLRSSNLVYKDKLSYLLEFVLVKPSQHLLSGSFQSFAKNIKLKVVLSFQAKKEELVFMVGLPLFSRVLIKGFANRMIHLHSAVMFSGLVY